MEWYWWLMALVIGCGAAYIYVNQKPVAKGCSSCPNKSPPPE
jgi:hypothetical protein